MGAIESDVLDTCHGSAIRESGDPSARDGSVGRRPPSTSVAGTAISDDDPGPDGHAVKWLLAAGLLRKLAAIARSLLGNELDLRDWMSQSTVGEFCTGRDEVWFDYIADTGDDPRVMRALATSFGREFEARELGEHPKLPVGDFLFVGGDTAYYVSDETTLRQRFVSPLNAAHAAGAGPARRPIFAIPGNHDYYDHLVGFNRLFRTSYPKNAPGVLGLAGFHTSQEASYIKIRLPHGWQLWGVDLQTHGLDYRQRMYFRSEPLPERLIVCTPSPPVSLGRVQVERDPKDPQRKAYVQLLEPQREANATEAPLPFDPAFTPDSDGVKPAPGACRLFLSGDDHHYARYGGPAPTDSTPLATIVSGGGGAFTHPTEHECGSLEASVKYPPASSSRDRTAAALVNPLVVIRAGMLHFVGAGLAWLFFSNWPQDLASLVGPAIWTACVAASLGLGVGSLALTVHLSRRRARHAKRARHGGAPPASHRTERLREMSVFLAPIGIILAVALPIQLHRYVPQMDPLSGTSLWLVCATILVIALVLFASLRGAADLAGGWPKVGFGLLGLAHAAMQLVLPYLLVLRGPLLAAVAIVAMLLVFAPAAKRLYRRAPAWLITALWLVQGLGAIAALWWMPWGHGISSSLDWLSGAGYSSMLAVLVGAIVVPMQFGFYLLTCSAWNGHNNEAGITARVTLCKQWIRFHVTKDALTGYVIGIDDPMARPLRPRLVDRFVIAPAAESAQSRTAASHE